MLDKITNILRNNRYLNYYPIISGAIISISFNFPYLWFLSFIGFIPFFIFLYENNLDSKKVFWNGLLFGFIFIGSVLSLFWSTYPLEWAGIESKLTAFLLILIVWGLSSVFFALFIASWSAIFYKFKRNNFSDILFASSLWIIFEYIRALAFSILWISPVSLIGPHWTLGFLGYILTGNTIILSLAGIGGIYLLSFIVIVLNLSIYHILFNIKKTNAVKLKILTLLFVFITTISLLSYVYTNKNNENNKTLKIAVISTSLPSFFYTSKSSLLNHVNKIQNIFIDIKKSGNNPDIIILPEDSRFIKYLNETEKKILTSEILENETLLIDSSQNTNNQGKKVSELIYLNTKTGEKYSNKRLLVPFGEYLPHSASLLLKILGKGDVVENFNKSRGYDNGKDISSAVIDFKGIKIGSLFCSEIISDKLNRDVTKLGANILINISSNSVFNGSKAVHIQKLQMAKMRAVENNRYFIQSTNFSSSFVINNKGNMEITSNKKGYGVIYKDVQIIYKPSLYNVFGNWILLISLILLIVKVVYHQKSKQVGL